MNTTYDLIILGSGSTAFAAALRATHHGARVLMFEKSVLEGTCINWGCIPSKTLIHEALFRHEAYLGAGLGIIGENCLDTFDAERLFAHRESVVAKLRQERYLDILGTMKGLELVKGTARFGLETTGVLLNNNGFVIAERESGQLLGVHLVCHRGADLINEASLALRLKATVSDLASTMHVYPSIGEGLKLCAQGFNQDISLLSCCAE